MAIVSDVLERVARRIRDGDLIEPGGPVSVLVSGGADSSCLWHALRELGYEVAALHVAHGLRGSESEADAEHCRRALGAEVVRVRPGSTEAELRDLRYAVAIDRLRATGHTASDQAETVLYRLVASGTTRGIRPRRSDGVVRPLLDVWRAETDAYCREAGLTVRVDSSNADTQRGLIREQVMPLLERLHPGAAANLVALAEREPRLPRAVERSLLSLLDRDSGSRSADLGEGVRAVREYDMLRLEGTVVWGPWRIEPRRSGLSVRRRRPGDRLAGRKKKVQDIMVDAKVPLAERDRWPVVVADDGDVVVAVPGLAEAPGWEGAVRASEGP